MNKGLIRSKAIFKWTCLRVGVNLSFVGVLESDTNWAALSPHI